MKKIENSDERISNYLLDCPICYHKIRRGSKITQLHENCSMNLRNSDVRYGSRWIHLSCRNCKVLINDSTSKYICDSYISSI